MREFIWTGRPVPRVDPDSLPSLIKSSEPESSGSPGGGFWAPRISLVGSHPTVWPRKLCALDDHVTDWNFGDFVAFQHDSR